MFTLLVFQVVCLYLTLLVIKHCNCNREGRYAQTQTQIEKENDPHNYHRVGDGIVVGSGQTMQLEHCPNSRELPLRQRNPGKRQRTFWIVLEQEPPR